MIDHIQTVDESVLLYFAENLRRGGLNGAMMFITTLGDGGAVWLITSVILMVFREHRRQGYMVLACVVVCTVVNTLILKNIIARPRPFDTMPELTLLIKPPGDFSFPSGHAASSFASAFALTVCYGKPGAWSYLAAALIAFSRIYVGVHYPSDVVAGTIIGTGCAWASCSALPKIMRW